MKNILTALRNDLKSNASEERRISGERFFKEPVKMYGMRASQLSAIAKTHFIHVKGLSKKEVWELCEQLWKSGLYEEAIVACIWSCKIKKQFTPEDFPVFEKWVTQYITNWAACDTFCNHTMGTFLEMYPDFLKDLKKWTRSGNRWVRRAAAVSLIVPARKGMWLDDVFEIATAMLHDTDDMVQKGYGWMLKVAANKHEKEVFDFVCKHKDTMPRTALRYAIEKMPEILKKKAMERE